jgi:deoxyadenosine/deoxycytidine kinase
MTLNYKLVSIEGNIGSGKSTLLAYLKQKYGDNQTIIFLKEPVDEWEQIKDSNGNTMLKKFYADQQKYAFPFQMMAYISRLKILRDTVRVALANPSKQYIIITERSLYTDKHVFAKMLYEQGNIEDVCYQIYLNWFDEFAKDFPINYTIYVNAEPNTCYKRIHKRARDGEEVIPLDYLVSCHQYHESFLDTKTGIPTKQLVLDGNVDIYENINILKQWLKQIDEFIETNTTCENQQYCNI